MFASKYSFDHFFGAFSIIYDLTRGRNVRLTLTYWDALPAGRQMQVVINNINDNPPQLSNGELMVPR